MLSRIYSPSKQEQGFTLIELLVVIIIIGILAAIAIPLFLDQRKLAVDASIKADVRNTVANVQTWQANDETKRTKAEANTGAYVADGGKIAQTPGNSIGVSIDASGAATVCAYNSGGKTYLADSAAYVFNPATGQFSTGSCATGSTTGGTSNGSSGGAAASTPVLSFDFETGTLQGWTVITGNTVAANDAYAKSNGSTYAMRMQSQAPNRVRYNSLATANLVAGSTYTMTGDFSAQGSSNRTLRIATLDSGGSFKANTGALTVPTNWGSKFTMDFTYAAGDSLYMSWDGTDSTPSFIYVDNIQITPKN